MAISTFGRGHAASQTDQQWYQNELMHKQVEAMRQQYMSQAGYAQPQQAVALVAPQQNKKVLLLLPKKGK